MRITLLLARPSGCLSPLFCSDLVALSNVFVVRYFRVVCITGEAEIRRKGEVSQYFVKFRKQSVLG